jgi:hypothetical protein
LDRVGLAWLRDSHDDGIRAATRDVFGYESLPNLGSQAIEVMGHALDQLISMAGMVAAPSMTRTSGRVDHRDLPR